MSQVAGVTDKGLKPRPIRSVAIIGGGLMGSGIATALVLAGIPVLLKEVNQDFLQAGVDRISGEITSGPVLQVFSLQPIAVRLLSLLFDRVFL